MPEPTENNGRSTELEDAEALQQSVIAFKAKHPEASFVYGLMTSEGVRFFRRGGAPPIQVSLATFLQHQAQMQDFRDVAPKVIEPSPEQTAEIHRSMGGRS